MNPRPPLKLLVDTSAHWPGLSEAARADSVETKALTGNKSKKNKIR